MFYLAKKLRTFEDVAVSQDIQLIRPSAQAIEDEEQSNGFVKIWLATDITHSDDVEQRVSAFDGEWRAARAVAKASPCYLHTQHDSLGTTYAIISLQPEALRMLTSILYNLHPSMRAVTVDPFLRMHDSSPTQSLEFVDPETKSETLLILDEPEPLGSIMKRYGDRLFSVSILLDPAAGISLHANRATQQVGISMPPAASAREAEMASLSSLLPLIDEIFTDESHSVGMATR